MRVDERIRELVTDLIELLYRINLFIEKVINWAFTTHETQAFLSFKVDAIETVILAAHSLVYQIQSMIKI